MLSVNTNTGAMVALQQLNATNRDLTEVQTRINTGLKVADQRTTAQFTHDCSEHARRDCRLRSRQDRSG